jgi:hypothetical protein
MSYKIDANCVGAFFMAKRLILDRSYCPPTMANFLSIEAFNQRDVPEVGAAGFRMTMDS